MSRDTGRQRCVPFQVSRQNDSEGSWVSLDVRKLLEYWFKVPSENLGIVLQATGPRDPLGRSLIITDVQEADGSLVQVLVLILLLIMAIIAEWVEDYSSTKNTGIRFLVKSIWLETVTITVFREAHQAIGSGYLRSRQVISEALVRPENSDKRPWPGAYTNFTFYFT